MFTFFAKIFSRNKPTAFNKTAVDYITPDMVRIANDKLMGKYTPREPDVFEKHGLTRPTSEQIEAAGANALRNHRLKATSKLK